MVSASGATKWLTTTGVGVPVDVPSTCSVASTGAAGAIEIGAVPVVSAAVTSAIGTGSATVFATPASIVADGAASAAAGCRGADPGTDEADEEDGPPETKRSMSSSESDSIA